MQRESTRTTVSAGKEHLLEVGLLHVCAIYPAFELTNGRMRSVFDVEGRDKLDTVLIESQRVAEVLDGVIRTAERQIFRN